MTSPIFDFRHLSTAERIQLAEDLWDSLETGEHSLSAEQTAELDRRREQLRTDGVLGKPWQDVLDRLDRRGT